MSGLKVNWIELRDADTGKMLWEGNEGFATEIDKVIEFSARVPKNISKCEAVSLEFNFSSEGALKKCRLEQGIMHKERCLEELNFEFGFIIPNSTSTWKSLIERSQETQKLPLNDNVVIELKFYEDDRKINTTKIKLYFDNLDELIYCNVNKYSVIRNFI